MATFKYFLRDTKAEKETPLVLIISAGKKIKVPTGESIHPKHWNQAEQKVKRSLTGFSDINATLKYLIESAESAYRKFKALGIEPTGQQIRDAIKPEQEEGLINPAELFKEAYNSFLDLYETTKQPNTHKKFKTLKLHLDNFSELKKCSLTFEAITMRFYEQFTTYLIKDLKHTNNTVGKVVMNLKTFLKWATERGYNNNQAFTKFKVPNEKADIIYLTEPELMVIYNLELSKNKTLAKVRDVFCFGCFTGQRFSDVAALKREDIKNDTWYLRTQKTKDVIEIPLNAYALEILSRYVDKDIPLPVMSNQKTNSYLKDIGELAEIKETITQVRFRGNERIEQTLPKHDFISTHTARRTFVTLWLEKGGRPETCMEITGHKDYKTFKKYIKITSKVKRVEMDQIWFKDPVLKVVS
jgi:integrase